ncbi:MAG: hypothetical protein JWN03_4106 [Nocardia sp.]|nr:hypothetical protein [Nocardia sp.]
MFDSRLPASRRVIARICVIAALSAISVGVADIPAFATPCDSSGGVSSDRPYPGSDSWHHGPEWRSPYPDPPPFGYPPPWDGPVPRDSRHGQLPYPPRPPLACTGSFGSC